MCIYVCVRVGVGVCVCVCERKYHKAAVRHADTPALLGAGSRQAFSHHLIHGCYILRSTHRCIYTHITYHTHAYIQYTHTHTLTYTHIQYTHICTHKQAVRVHADTHQKPSKCWDGEDADWRSETPLPALCLIQPRQR